MTVAAFSGGKDSTAMVLHMRNRGEHALMLFTPAQNEPPELFDHVRSIEYLTGFKVIELKAPTLLDLIEQYNALPNHRQRWCTRQIKILPAMAWLKGHPGSTLCIGLRSDEPKREGMYGDHCHYRYPLREAGFDECQVMRFLAAEHITVPKRTNCMFCYGQRIGEWYELWRDRKDIWSQGEAIESKTGRTWRSPRRDTWPVAMKDLRAAFEGGRVPKERQAFYGCRVCSL